MFPTAPGSSDPVGVAGAAAGTGGAPAPARATGGWVGTWVSTPQRTEPDNMPPPPFARDGLVLADVTLRQTVRVSVGGRPVRLRFSNAFGGAALPITGASIARPAGGRAGVSGIEPGSSRPVTFSGRSRVVVPVGAQAVSDPLDVELAPGANLTVTVYLAEGQATNDLTSHPGSRTTSYLMAGNRLASTDPPAATPIEHWYLLSGVEVWAGGDTAAAVLLGDSLTDGRGSTTDRNDRWPDRLLDRLQSDRRTSGVAILNQAAGGNRVLDDGLGPNALARLDRDVLAQSGVEWLLVFAGINDIGTAEATGAAQRRIADDLIAAYDQIIVRTRAHGIRVYGGTLLPFGGNADYDDARGLRERARGTVNDWIRRGGRFDAVVDFDLAARDPRHPRRLRAELDEGDHLHLNPAGYQALADAVPARLFHREPLPPGFGFG